MAPTLVYIKVFNKTCVVSTPYISYSVESANLSLE